MKRISRRGVLVARNTAVAGQQGVCLVCEKVVVARFDFIWQLLSNHEVISLKIRLVIYNQTVQLVIFFNYI